MSDTWQDLEALAARIYTALAPDAEVTADEHIVGRSGVRRQIDVAVRTRVAGHDLLLIVDAKKYRRPVSIKEVEAFAGMVGDVRAIKGVMISDSGYSGGAMKAAKEHGIDLCSAVDANSRPWKDDLSIPVLFYEYELSFNLHTKVGPFDERAEQLNKDKRVFLALTRDSGKSTTKWSIECCRLWNDGILVRDDGTHGYDFRRFRLSCG